ncbi:hypothetical protein HanIR_Chr17g0893891 [Helianthus annuus]|nr:hypothetical protein HanIR_Chr17g0893891 [Helianthus annuus]
MVCLAYDQVPDCSTPYESVLVSQFDTNSPCDRIDLLSTHQTIQNLFLSYVKVI